jgi:hypothetical protein
VTSIDDNSRIDRSGPGLGQRRPISPPPTRTAIEVAPEADPATKPADGAEHEPATLMIRVWLDPVVDETGHDPRSHYVEQFWLGVLDPTATWLLRRLVAGLAQQPDGYEINLDVTTRAMGMSYRPNRSSPFSKAMHDVRPRPPDERRHRRASPSTDGCASTSSTDAGRNATSPRRVGAHHNRRRPATRQPAE